MKNTITQQHINNLIENAVIYTQTIFDKCTFVSVQLENGFILTESSACVDPANFDEKIGYDICIERIKNKLWELEGYALQKKLFDYKPLGTVEEEIKKFRELRNKEKEEKEKLNKALGRTQEEE